MYRIPRAALAATCGTALLALSACGGWSSWSGPTAPSGTITRLEERAVAFETDCVVDTDGPSCTIEQEPNCNLVVFEDGDGLEYSDCVSQTEWERLNVGDSYTDRED